jgi:hypothetical protein
VRTFQLVRTTDVTGISGTGVVAEGVEWSDGTVVLRWLPSATTRGAAGVRPTTVIHEDVHSVVALHGHGAATVVRYDDGTVLAQRPEP